VRVYAILNPFALGVALRVATWRRNHHRQVTAMVEGIAHTLSNESRLQPATAQFRHCCRTTEQRNSIMDTKHSSGAWYAVNLADEA
jgi:hypothetical protein